jgi:ATP/maltotriose-dependent transcriptional regulator MalT
MGEQRRQRAPLSEWDSGGLLVRSSLLDELEAGHLPITILAAPGGYGK